VTRDHYERDAVEAVSRAVTSTSLSRIVALLAASKRCQHAEPACQQLRTCPDVQSVLDRLLRHALEVTNADRGDVQLVDRPTGSLLIKAQSGLHEEFLRFFACIRVIGGSACARALRDIGPAVIEDVDSDEEFAPYREIAHCEGFRAVVSIPLVSTIRTVVGVVSTHFPMCHRPSDSQLSALIEAGRLATNAIILRRAQSRVIGDVLTDSAIVVAETIRAVSESERRIKQADLVLEKTDQLLRVSHLAIRRSKLSR